MSGLSDFRLRRQNIITDRILIRKSPRTGTLAHPDFEAVLVAKIKQANPAARNR